MRQDWCTPGLWHALHTPTNLTPSKLRKAVGDWFLLPDGDHARVTLVFGPAATAGPGRPGARAAPPGCRRTVCP